ncbi:MAG: hypothetical protein ACYTAF_17395, partial [Planctomycetota bacterium]
MARVAFLALLLAALPADLDVGVPPGTPLEWDGGRQHPVPTGGRADVPTGSRPTGGREDVPTKDTSKGPRGSTVAEDVEKSATPSRAAYSVTNLYAFFRVTTQDIMTHVTVNVPRTTAGVGQGGTATGGRAPYTMVWKYPPEIPTELFWMGCMATLRGQIHPEVVSVPESVLYCIE